MYIRGTFQMIFSALSQTEYHLRGLKKILTTLCKHDGVKAGAHHIRLVHLVRGATYKDRNRVWSDLIWSTRSHIPDPIRRMSIARWIINDPSWSVLGRGQLLHYLCFTDVFLYKYSDGHGKFLASGNPDNPR